MNKPDEKLSLKKNNNQVKNKMQFLRQNLFCCAAAFLTCIFSACSRTVETPPEDEMTDPTATYSLIRSDSSSGIEIISNSGNNPLKVRESLRSYVIPENSFPAKRAKLYSLLNQLEKKTRTDSVNYGEVDSLNYLSIHYLQDLLRDPQSVTSGIRHRMLNTCFSPDKRLRIYSWNENLSPKWKSFINVYQYRKQDHTFDVAFNEESSPHDASDFRCGRTNRIIQLHTDGDSYDLYLLLFSGCQGTEHLFKGAGCVRTDSDGIHFNYPVFSAQHSSISLHYTKNARASITYDNKKHSLHVLRIAPKQDANDTFECTYLYDGCHFTLEE